MHTQVIRRILDLINIDPNTRAELHEKINEDVAAVKLAPVPEDPPAPAAPAVVDTPPEEPPGVPQLV